MSNAPAMLLILFFLLGAATCGRRPSDNPVSVRIAFFDSIQATPVFIAIDKGFFREEGVDVQPMKVRAGSEALKEVAEGRADFGTAADLPIVRAILGGEKNLAIVATIQSSRKLTLVVARKDRGIDSPADLKGKRIAVVGGAVNEFLLHNILVYNGIRPEETRITDIGNPERYEEVFSSDSFDAVSTWYPYASLLLSRLGKNGIAFFGEGFYRETFSLVSRPDFLEKNPTGAERVLRALIRTRAFILENPGEAREMVARRLSIDEGSLSAVWDDISFNISLDLALVGTMEAEAVWAVNHRPEMQGKEIPSFFDYIYPASLASVRPEGVFLRR